MEPDDEESQIRLILAKGKISSSDVETLKNCELLDRTKLITYSSINISLISSIPIDVVIDIQRQIANAVSSEFKFVEEVPVIQKWFDDEKLDSVLALPTDGIIEFVGLSGVGKSNIVYQMIVNRIFKSRSEVAYLIVTEGNVPTRRIEKLCLYRGENRVDQIIIDKCLDVTELYNKITKELPQMFFSSDIKPSIVVIDSIAIFRSEFSIETANERALLLFDISNILKWLSHTFGVLIVTTNQATSSFDYFLGREWVPSLGLAWSNCVSVRIKVSKSGLKREIETEGGETQQVTIRKAYVELSPISQGKEVSFYVTESGIRSF